MGGHEINQFLLLEIDPDQWVFRTFLAPMMHIFFSYHHRTGNQVTQSPLIPPQKTEEVDRQGQDHYGIADNGAKKSAGFPRLFIDNSNMDKALANTLSAQAILK
jgi:hypothetical protein